MAQVELIMPKMGESIMEATILQWVKNVGDKIEMDETVLEISTDKVDSEVPSTVEGVLTKILFQVNDVVPIGQAVAIIEVEGAAVGLPVTKVPSVQPEITNVERVKVSHSPPQAKPLAQKISSSTTFLSPLVRNIAKEESIPLHELEQISGSGKNGRITKADLLLYIDNRSKAPSPPAPTNSPTHTIAPVSQSSVAEQAKSISGNVEIIEMSRMRKLIAKHMVDSKQTSPHVTSFIEVNVSPIVDWRINIKEQFIAKYGEKITFTPIFIDAVINGIRQYPLINSSLVGDQIIVKKDINIGMAAAMENGNLIVPVIKKADHLNLVGMTKTVNDLASRARINKLKPEEIQDGTFTLTNIGTFGSLMGTPIINQPQVAILAVGAIKKKPVVIETSQGDVIGIRHMMMMSLSYDHRVIDGALGSKFLKSVADTLEGFTPKEI